MSRIALADILIALLVAGIIGAAFLIRYNSRDRRIARQRARERSRR